MNDPSPAPPPASAIHVVGPTDAGDRLDALLHRWLPSTSRRQARQLCELGAVAVDGVRAGAATHPHPGAVVAIAAAALPLQFALGIPIVHADAGVLVLYKLPGLAVHGGPLVDRSVADALAAHCPGAGLAQRLDRGASGLLLVGRDRDSLRRLGAAMEHGDIARCYLAIVHGALSGAPFAIDLPLRATDEPRGDRPKVVVDHQHGQPARTHVEIVAQRKAATLVRLQLETGRTHQIRAHLAAIGHPLLGDPRYGDVAANAAARATHGVDRPLLHGHRLVFPAADGTPTTVTAWHEPEFVRLFPLLRSTAAPSGEAGHDQPR